MSVEYATYVGGLNPLMPKEVDLISEGDDQIRLIKSATKNAFPNIDKAVTCAADTLNSFDSDFTITTELTKVTGNVDGSGLVINAAGNQIKNVADPTGNDDGVTFGYLNTLLNEAIYPIGHVVIGYDDDPAKILGFGTWERFYPGRALVCAGADGSGSIQHGGPMGNDSVILSERNLAAHQHACDLRIVFNPDGQHVHPLVVTHLTKIPGAITRPRSQQHDVADAHNIDDNYLLATDGAGQHTHNYRVTGGIAGAGKSAPVSLIQKSVGINTWIRKA